jgi:hypothetical protein
MKSIATLAKKFFLWFTYYSFRLQPEQLAKLRHYLGIEADPPVAEVEDQTQLLKVSK